jgi:Uma2 family endonuclease
MPTGPHPRIWRSGLKAVEVLRKKENEEVNMAIPTNPITVEQYEHSFEGYPGLRDELINGRIVMTPLPKPLHQHIRQNIEDLLDAACEGTEYIVNGNSNIKIPSSNSAPSPDVFVVARARWEDAMRADTYLTGAPLLVVEVLAPSEDVSEKVDIYLDAGVTTLWIVDPERHTVLIHSSLGANLNMHIQEHYSRPAMSSCDLSLDDPSSTAEKRILVEASFLDSPKIPLPLLLHGPISIDLIFAGLP